MHRKFVHARSRPQLPGGGFLFWANMMSIAARCGALSPYLQASKHTVQGLALPGAKELVPAAAGKAEQQRLDRQY